MVTEVSHPQKLRKSFIIKNLRILEFMVNERIIKNYPSQATGILHAPVWKNRKWLTISSQIPTNSIIKKNSIIL